MEANMASLRLSDRFRMLALDKLQCLVRDVSCMVYGVWCSLHGHESSTTATRKSVQPLTLATGSQSLQFMPKQADDMMAERIMANICGQ